MPRKAMPAPVRSLIEELRTTVPDSRSSQSRIDQHFGQYPVLLDEILAAAARHVSYETIAAKLSTIAPEGVEITGGIVSTWIKRNKNRGNN